MGELVVSHRTRQGAHLEVVRADTAAGRSTVYRLRHQVYVQQTGILPPDHAFVHGDEVRDARDAHATHLLLRIDGVPAGAARFTERRHGSLEIDDVLEVAAVVPDPRRTAEVGRLLVLREHRGTLASPMLLWAIFRAMHRSGCRHVFVASRPGPLDRLYRNVFAAGLTVLADPFVHPIDGKDYIVMVADIGEPGSLRRRVWRLHEALLVGLVLHTPVGPAVLRRGR
jgi:hypothetical protein